MEATNFYIAAALIVGILFPGYAILDGVKTRQLLQNDPSKKVYIFQVTAIQLIVLMVVSLVPFWIDRLSPTVIGLEFISNPFWIIGLFVISFLGLWLFNQIGFTPESAQKVQQQHSRIQFLLPTTAREYRLMVIVSFIAGICEEILYRGFLLWFLSGHLPLIPSIILANLPFALAHLTTTGVKNTFVAFILALVFTGAFLLTQSLWLCILLHILVDLYSVTISYKSTKVLQTNS